MISLIILRIHLKIHVNALCSFWQIAEVQRMMQVEEIQF